MITRENAKDACPVEFFSAMMDAGYLDTYEFIDTLLDMVPEHRLEMLKNEMIEYFLED